MSEAVGSGSRLTRVVLEATVIIGSILTAFAIDAAWAERENRAQEAALLSSLTADFEASRLNLDAALGWHRQVRDAADRLMRITDQEALAAAHPDSLQRWVYMVVHAVPSFEPANGTLEAVLNTGRADLIRDHSLMAELTRWTALVDDFVEGEEQAIRHNLDTLYPAFAARLNLRDVRHPGMSVGHRLLWEGPRGDPGPYASRD